MACIVYNDDAVTPSVNVSEDFQMNFVAVTLEWIANNGVSYVVNITPEIAINYMGKSSARLILSYNTEYNVSVVASLCGTSEAVHSTINYSKLQRFISSGNQYTIIALLLLYRNMPSNSELRLFHTSYK